MRPDKLSTRAGTGTATGTSENRDKNSNRRRKMFSIPRKGIGNRKQHERSDPTFGTSSSCHERHSRLIFLICMRERRIVIFTTGELQSPTPRRIIDLNRRIMSQYVNNLN